VAAGYLVATTVHFFLQRTVVFRSAHGFELSITEQAVRFAALVVCQYAVTVGAMSVLPDLLGAPELAIYLAVAVVVAGLSFIVLRHERGSRIAG
jgi:putative flippase GtrA